MEAIMLIDFGSTYTKVTGVDLEREEILGTSKSFTTVETDICLGLEKAIHQLEEQTGALEWKFKYACSSAAGGLRMIAVGLVNDLTSKAAKEAALSAGAKVLKVYSMELTDDDILDINMLKPDILLLTGGTDGGNQKIVLHNANQLAKTEGTFPIIYSGNRSVKNQVCNILETNNREVIPTENVMPKFGLLNISPAQEAIKAVFINKIIEAKGIKNAESLIDNVLMPTPLAVMNGVKLLGDGYNSETGMGDLMVVDIGGATTDIHSVCDGFPTVANVILKGIEEPRVKRSVEGDLGARYSLSSALEISDKKLLAWQLGLAMEELEDLIQSLVNNPQLVGDELTLRKDLKPMDKYPERIRDFDDLIAKLVTKESVKRHCGFLKEHYTPFGLCYEQFGKDLTKVTKIIGTGGPLIHSKDPRAILESASFEEGSPFVLKPKLTQYYLDHHYILAAMGLLASFNKEIAYRILLKNLKEI